MTSMNWQDLLIAGVLVLCVLGPNFVVLFTQNLLDAADEIDAEHFDFDAIAQTQAEPGTVSRRVFNPVDGVPSNRHDC